MNRNSFNQSQLAHPAARAQGPSAKHGFVGLVLTISLLASRISPAAVLHINGNAAACGDGSSWESPLTRLETALMQALPGDELRIAEGTYRPSSEGDREAHFLLKSGLVLRGGYSGRSREGDHRDPENHLTVLSGDLAANDDSTGQNRADNSFRVVVAENIRGTLLDGLCIEGGHADTYPDLKDGGGLLVESSELTLRNCLLQGNFGFNTGGAVYANQSELTLDSCRFRQNSSIGYGGGLACADSWITLKNCSFADNLAEGGGGNAVDAWRSRLVLENCEFNAGNDQTVQSLESEVDSIKTSHEPTVRKGSEAKPRAGIRWPWNKSHGATETQTRFGREL